MRHQGVRRQATASFVLTVTLLLSAGCSTLNPAKAAPPEPFPACPVPPACCRNHVYVMIIHGTDPLDFANLQGLREYIIHQLGYPKTYLGQLYHTSHLEKELRRVHREDPLARFVLIGFSFGANQVRNVTNAVRAEGITIDLLVYLGGNTLHNVPRDRPDNALRLVNILAAGCIWNGAWMDGALNVHERDVWHFGSPTHPRTLAILAQELPLVGSRVPVVETSYSPLTSRAWEEPTPRPVSVQPVPAARDEWDFLKLAPRSSLLTR